MSNPTPHPLEKASAEALRAAAGELWADIEGSVNQQIGAPGELQTMAVHASTLLMRADLADLRSEIREMTNNPNPRG